ncbi:hypothetical protein A0J61_09151 [Choanephora cucurbitarum]|uniref:Reverse transcriptase domain-containing protein n=1 Tax=Choanephora cucurbitarum TaxID=101091 RepID=A0A1C7N2E7_9FUNG|nr:hypothetical protein A0J61_09151 [Choanephora cucurbitarum]
MGDAHYNRSKVFGIMLYQHKAYDRIHPVYLEKVLLRFGFSLKFCQIIDKLFFLSNFVINVNGHLSRQITPHQGLRQGDSISPILFNLALEPLLLSILQCDSLSGYSFSYRPPSASLTLPSPQPINVLAYADDGIQFLNQQSQIRAIPTLRCSRQSFGTTAGGGEQQSVTQRDVFIDKALQRVKSSIGIHLQPNTLILSSLWHVLRVTILSKRSFSQLTSIIVGFISNDGLAMLDPGTQQLVLQRRFAVAPLTSKQSLQFPSWIDNDLTHVLQVLCNTLSFQIPLMMASARPHLLGCGFRPFSLILRTIDGFNLNPNVPLALSATSWLMLPMSAICITSTAGVLQLSR